MKLVFAGAQMPGYIFHNANDALKNEAHPMALHQFCLVAGGGGGDTRFNIDLIASSSLISNSVINSSNFSILGITRPHATFLCDLA